MKKIGLIALLFSGFALAGASCGSSSSNSSSTSAPTADAKAATADSNPAMSEPDKVGWTFFIQAVQPAGQVATFETWATDADTFVANPQFPTGRTTRAFHARVVPALARAATRSRAFRPHLLLESTGIRTNEDVHRNLPAFKFIVDNHLNTLSGLKAGFGKTFSFPPESIEIKTNWVAVADIPAFTHNAVPAADVAKYFYISHDVGNTAWALVAMHVISKTVPNWTWATFESRFNPARCDIIGCRDSFGAAVPAVQPNAQPNAGYGACDKTAVLQTMFSAAAVNPIFANYCLKGSQADFTDNEGLATRLGNSITEAGNVQNSSCMTCHGQASWDQAGGEQGFDFVYGPIDPSVFWQYSGTKPYQDMPGMTRKATSADFVWAIPFCAYDDSQPNPTFPCAPPSKEAREPAPGPASGRAGNAGKVTKGG